MKLSTLQERIVNTEAPYVAVVAAAAAGKTATLTERVRKMLKDGTNPSDMAVITFTNMAAQELRERLADDYKDGIYIGTIHGLANRFLLSHGIDTGDLIKKEQFDEFFKLLKENPYCVKHIKHILLDESQDTSSEEFDFIFNMIEPDTFFVVGDFRQSIYSFKGADPELFMNLLDSPQVQVYSLNENYRNGSNILTFAKDILRRGRLADDSVPMRQGGYVYQGPPDIKNVYGWIENTGPYKDWAILCSTNAEIDWMIRQLKMADIPCVTFKQGDVTKDQLDELMQSDTVKVLTRHSAKGLEFPNVIVWEPAWWGGNETYRVNYVAATRARDRLLWLESKKNSKKRKYF